MAANQTIKRGAILFLIYDKSIAVVTNGIRREVVFYAREPTDEDVDQLCRLIDLGAAMQAECLQEALKPYKIPRS